MREELELLADHVPRFLLDLVRPPDLDGDGAADWPAVENLHIAVAPTGLDGAFTTLGDPSRDECAETYPMILTIDGPENLDAVVGDVSCLATAQFSGTEEAILGTMARAILPTTSGVMTPAGPPLGDTAHRGFLRADSVLVLLFITDEDDETRCVVDVAGGECLPESTPTAYTDALRALRPADHLLIGTLAGAPVGATTREEVFDSFEEPRGGRVCAEGLISARPAPRMADFTFGLGGLYRSVCSRSYAELTERVARQVGETACAP